MDDIYIRRVCEGDTESFRYLLDKYKDMAFTVAVSVVKDEFAAEEVVQEAFLKAFGGLRSFNGKSKFSTWFYRIVANEAFQRLKRSKREIVSFTEEYGQDTADEGPLLSMQQEEQVHQVNEALGKLSPNESLALRLFYLQEESVQEVCDITGWSESKVKVTLHRARRNMYSILKQLQNLK